MALATSILGAEGAGTVRASAQATVVAHPDSAQLQVSVTTEAQTAQVASAANAEKSTKLINAIHAQFPGVQVTTSGYSVNPQYVYGQGKPPQLTGYRAMNTVELSTNDVSGTGKLIDAAVQAGGDTVSGVSFRLRDDAPVRDEALALAAQKARADAEAIAKALGLRVTGVLQAETAEGGEPIRPVARALVTSAQTTPVEAGTLDYTARVTVTVGVSGP